MEQAKAILEVFKASNTSAPGALIDDKLPQKIYGETHPKEEVVEMLPQPLASSPLFVGWCQQFLL